ncbi:MAG: hypothetical protein M3N95_07410 [Actinomycetota bacterium]|nr:hypothetical protein [Actinomycetota bacterium]
MSHTPTLSAPDRAHHVDNDSWFEGLVESGSAQKGQADSTRPLIGKTASLQRRLPGDVEIATRPDYFQLTHSDIGI